MPHYKAKPNKDASKVSGIKSSTRDTKPKRFGQSKGTGSEIGPYPAISDLFRKDREVDKAFKNPGMFNQNFDRAVSERDKAYHNLNNIQREVIGANDRVFGLNRSPKEMDRVANERMKMQYDYTKEQNRIRNAKIKKVREEVRKADAKRKAEAKKKGK